MWYSSFLRLEILRLYQVKWFEPLYPNSMPQVSKYPLRQEVYERIFDLLLKIFIDSSSKREAAELLEELLTPTERVMIAKRLATAVLLIKGYEYKDIQDVLHVSKPTIANVNIAMKYEGKGYKKFAERIFKEEKMSKFWEGVGDMALDAFSRGKGGGTWRYIHQELKKKRRKKQTPI